MKLKVKGDFKTGRELMKIRRRQLEKAYRENSKSFMSDSKYRSFMKQIKLHSVTQTLPIKIENIVVNKILLKQLLWRLRGYVVRYTVSEDHITFIYNSFDDQIKGRMVLWDLSRHFKYLRDIPEGELVDG